MGTRLAYGAVIRGGKLNPLDVREANDRGFESRIAQNYVSTFVGMILMFVGFTNVVNI